MILDSGAPTQVQHGMEPQDVGPLVSRMRARLVHYSLVAVALTILARSVQLQLVEGAQWGLVAEKQQIRELTTTPMRGRILDATGRVLVETRELTRVTITPYQLRTTKKSGDSRARVRDGMRALDVPAALIRRAMDTTQKWVELPGLYAPSAVERFAGIPGVKRELVYRRMQSAAMGIQRVIGTVDNADLPQGGIEQATDSLLRGVKGRDALMLDGRGNRVITPTLSGVSAQPGHAVTLTLNQSLQEIAENELAKAMTRTGATGGDVVMLDPRDGSVLALAGARDGKPSPTSTALTQAYEPGSVMKPFIVARLLDAHRATPDEMVNTENGVFTLAKRTIKDEHIASQLPVRDVIRFSSNIGIVKLAQRFTTREEFELLRDFGFGAYSGVPYSAESRGRLRLPKDWKAQSSASIAMGYEMLATPLQIAVAYAAIANGGELLQPHLIRNIVDANGVVTYAQDRRVVRRVMSPQTALTMRTMLESVVDSGTSKEAELATFDVGGKSGTARRSERGRYLVGAYNATFAGMFPARAPQFVLVARLIDPIGKIYGGVVAGALVNGILQAALATRDVSLDRDALSRQAKPLPLPKPKSEHALELAARDSARFDSLRAPVPPAAVLLPAPASVVVELPLRTFVARGSVDSGRSDRMQVMPSVYGLDLRQAVRTLHALGLHVKIVNGKLGQTRPAAGALVRAGATVVLESAR